MQYLLATSLIASLLSVASARAVITERDSRLRAAYTLDNDAAGASIIAMKISLADGTLHSPVKTLTGGQGLPGNIANGPSVPDPLFSQNAVVVSENVGYPPKQLGPGAAIQTRSSHANQTFTHSISSPSTQDRTLCPCSPLTPTTLHVWFQLGSQPALLATFQLPLLTLQPSRQVSNEDHITLSVKILTL